MTGHPGGSSRVWAGPGLLGALGVGKAWHREGRARQGELVPPRKDGRSMRRTQPWERNAGRREEERGLPEVLPEAVCPGLRGCRGCKTSGQF